MPLGPQRWHIMTDHQPTPPPQQASFLRVVGAVLSAFIGIRKRQAADNDHVAIKPAHIVVAGIIGALLLIATLVTLVHFIIAR
jgi:amino acid transporter